jgi:shikimate dehydrogenase
VCISVAARPSNFGTTVHNAGYRALELNFIYKAFAVTDIGGAMAGVRALGIRGVSVSMPHKETVIAYLDAVDDTARVIGAVNTVVNQQGSLIGYNTDAYGAKVALQLLGDLSDSTVLVLGAGGAAKAILFALNELRPARVIVCNRTDDKADALARKWGFASVAWEDRETTVADVIINATLVGMNPAPDHMPIGREALKQCWGVMDVILSPMESRLIREAKSLGKKVVPGYKMSLYQAAAQFELYTTVAPPMEELEQAIVDMLKATTP